MDNMDDLIIEISNFLRTDSGEDLNKFTECSYRVQLDRNNNLFEIVNRKKSGWRILPQIVALQMIAFGLIWSIVLLPGAAAVIPLILFFVVVAIAISLFYKAAANTGKYWDHQDSTLRFRYDKATDMMEFPRDSVAYRKSSLCNLFILNSEETRGQNVFQPQISLYKMSLLFQLENGNWERHILTLNTGRSERDIKVLKQVLGCRSITWINGTVKQDK